MEGDGLEERLASAVGTRVIDTEEPHAWDASVDTIRHFARGCGDDNPLYSDPGYAARSARRVLVAPPLFPLATGLPEPLADGEAVVDLDVLVGGRHPRIVEDRWTLHRPITEGIRLVRRRHIAAAAGTDVTVRTQYLAEGTLYALHDRTRSYGAHAPARTVADGEPVTSEALAAIDHAYECESRRGGAPLRADDVVPGDAIGPVVRGPLTVTDLIAYRSGVGAGPLGGEPLRLAYLNRKRRPAVYSLDSLGVPDITERRHWDNDYARSVGHPGAYDYSHTRLVWCSHVLTDWMGDGGWLWELAGSAPLDSHVGDVQTIEGTVSSVDRHVSGCGVVTIALAVRNQRSETTCTARAIVLLPAAGATAVTQRQLVAIGTGVTAR